jgi:site-specific DNA-cytosine methylase
VGPNGSNTNRYKRAQRKHVQRTCNTCPVLLWRYAFVPINVTLHCTHYYYDCNYCVPTLARDSKILGPATGHCVLMGLESAFAWPRVSVLAICEKYGIEHGSQSILQLQEWSSCFSGIASAERARDPLVKAAQYTCGVCADWRTLSMCDASAASIEYLCRTCDSCVFGNVFDFFDFESPLEAATNYIDTWRVVSNATLSLKAYCHKHGQQCWYTPPQGDVSGFPCTPWSALGTRQGVDHPDTACLLAWARIHTELDTPIVLGENTPRVLSSVVAANFPNHAFQRIELAPRDCGFGLLARPRSYFLLTSLKKVGIVAPWSETIDVITSKLRLNESRPSDVYLADDAEVRNEELALGALRKRPPMPDYKQYRDLSYLLTPRGISYYRYFEHLREAQETQRVASADLVYHLGDNPAKRLAWSATSGSIPTFRRSCTICWAPSLRRWLTVREKLATMGWPTYPILASALDATVQTPSQDEGRLMVGNAMHLACVGVATLASLASVKLL